MKKHIQFSFHFLILFLILEATNAFGVDGGGEDAIYFASGNKVQGKLEKIEDDNVFFTVMKGDNPVLYSFKKENLLVAFNKNGNFLMISSLSTDTNEAKSQIDKFNQSPTREPKQDLIVKAVPLKVIPCQISYESDVIVNFKLQSGGVGSVNKSELVIILYKDGRHQFILPPEETQDLLKNTLLQIEEQSKILQKKSTDKADLASSNKVESSSQIPVEATSNTPEQALNKTTTGQPNKKIDSITKPQITEEEKQSYQTKAVQKVEEFGNYLGLITDKSLSGNDRDKAIDEAAKLFLPDAMIEVSSKRGPTKKYKVRDYLTRVKLLPYSSAKVEWSEIQYVNELKQQADGNYYGTITGQQTFTGFGGANGNNVLYSDVTKKNVKVKLQSYQKTIDGQNAVNWEVLLGNVGVANK